MTAILPSDEQGKDPAAMALGKKGGSASADKLSPSHRSKIAAKAAKARWTETRALVWT
jgi:hypothetical protein